MQPNLHTDFSFYDIVPDLPPLNVVDVGALPFEGSPEIYSALLKRGKVKLIAFEADKDGCEQLAAKLGPEHTVLPVVVGDGKDQTFHQNAHAATGSLLPPNMALINQFFGLSEYFQPTDSFAVQTQRLDDIIDLEAIDFLKLDVQGGELIVLDGAPKLARSALAIEIEVEFVPLYVDQPLFADVDTRLRSLGFFFHTFKDVQGRAYRPFKRPGGNLAGLNQLLWSDAIYVTDPSALDQYSDERLLKLVVILHDFYASVDLALRILSVLQDRGVTEPLRAYSKRLGFVL